MTNTGSRAINEILIIIGKNISQKRGNLTQEELAKIAKVGRSTLQSAEKGKSIELDNLLKIAIALKMNPADLFISDEDRQDITYKAKLVLDKIASALSIKGEK